MSLFMQGSKYNTGGRIYPIPAPVKWTEWKRTFCFLPRKSITGIFIVGPVWYRMQESLIHEYASDVGYYVSADLGYIEYIGFIEYADRKKDIFLRRLIGNK